MAKIVVPVTNTTITSAWGKSVADALNLLYQQGAFTTATTSAAGILHVTFPVSYGAAVPSFVATAITAGALYVPTITAVDGAGADVLIRLATTGANVANTSVGLSWMAVGPRP